jgi:hypothetical protein
MIGRSMDSWLSLFLFGAAYIQSSINRLMNLGMAGLGDPDEFDPDLSLGEWMNEYIALSPAWLSVADSEPRDDPDDPPEDLAAEEESGDD